MDMNPENEGETNAPQTNAPETNTPEPDDAIPQNAILIIEGVRVHPLQEAVVNIGRKFENHIIIDDPRISRTHAQLRAIRGHYVLFDLNSTGGTFVNGQRTKETVLYPGGVISLAGVTLVFGQDSPSPPADRVDTSPLGESGAGQRATPTMEKSTIDVKKNDIPTQLLRDDAAQRGSSDEKP